MTNNNTEKVYEVLAADLNIAESQPPQVEVTADGTTRTSGWTDAHLDAWEYVQPPEDGIWDFNFLATRPSGPSGDAITPIRSSLYRMDPMPENVRGVRIHAETNSIEVMLEEKIK